jgi:hypothetical protein
VGSRALLDTEGDKGVTGIDVLAEATVPLTLLSNDETKA